MLTSARSLIATTALLAVWLFAGAVQATDLEDAVLEYNTSAAQLQSLWNTYEDDHEDAWGDYLSMLDNFYYYLIDDNWADAMDFHDDYEEAQDSLKNTTGPALDESFEDFVLQLDETVDLLKLVIEQDVNSISEVAYVSGTSHFFLDDQPFPFWDDPGWDDYSEWVEFTFPNLVVGSPALYTSFAGTGLNDLFVLMQSATDPDGWINLIEWLADHCTDMQTVNDVHAADAEALCLVCAEEVQIWQLVRDWLINDRGYTAAEIADFCDAHGEAPYGDNFCIDLADQDQRDKARAARGCDEDRWHENLQDLLNVAQDYINPSYQYEPLFMSDPNAS